MVIMRMMSAMSTYIFQWAASPGGGHILHNLKVVSLAEGKVSISKQGKPAHIPD
jgi:hypothetical protein